MVSYDDVVFEMKLIKNFYCVKIAVSGNEVK